MAFQGKPLSMNLGLNESYDAAGRTVVLYGDSTAGKSTQLAQAAEYLANKYDKPVRLISAEDSSKTVFMPYVAAGLVQEVYISKIADPIGALRKLSKGQWPQADGSWSLPDPGSSCAYIIEGLSSIAEAVQEYNRENKLFLGEQKDNAHTTASGETIALPGQFSYNATQLEMLRALKQFAMIPGVKRVLWSAHEGKGTLTTHTVKDDKGRDVKVGTPIRGPLICGNAATEQVTKYCGMLLHCDILTEREKVTRRLHFVTHADPKVVNLVSPAKITLPLKAQPDFFKLLGANAAGYVDVTVVNGEIVGGIKDVIKAEDEAMEHLIASLSKKA